MDEHEAALAREWAHLRRMGVEQPPKTLIGALRKYSETLRLARRQAARMRRIEKAFGDQKRAKHVAEASLRAMVEEVK